MYSEEAGTVNERFLSDLSCQSFFSVGKGNISITDFDLKQTKKHHKIVQPFVTSCKIQVFL